MAISTEEKATLYRIMRVPSKGTYSFFTSKTSISTASLTDSWNVSSIRSDIETRADALDDDEKQDLIDLLTQWKKIKIGSTSEMKNGSIGAITGLSESDPRRRAQLRSEVADIIGIDLRAYWRWIDSFSINPNAGRLQRG